MVTGIPQITLKTSEGFVNAAEGDQDCLYAYCTAATRGPVLDPTTIASKSEAQRVFGLNLDPHFAQGASKVIVCRIAPGATDISNVDQVMKKAKKTFYAASLIPKTESTPAKTVILRKYTGTDDAPVVVLSTATEKAQCRELFTVETVNPGRGGEGNVEVSCASDGTYTLTVKIDGYKEYKRQGFSSLTSVAKRINNTFGDFLYVPVDENKNPIVTEPTSFKEVYVDGGNFKTRDITNFTITTDELQANVCEIQEFTGKDTTTPQGNSDYNPIEAGSNGKLGSYKKGTSEFVVDEEFDVDLKDDINKEYSDFKSLSYEDKFRPSNKLNGAIGNDICNAINVWGMSGPQIPNRNDTAKEAYQQAFKALENIDVFGVVANEDNIAVRALLYNHILDMNNPEVNMIRMGATSVLNEDIHFDSGTSSNYKFKVVKDATASTPHYDYYKKDCSVDNITKPCEALDSEYMVYVGQGVVFQGQDEKKIKEDRILSPLECVQLYTGIRSGKLAYHNAIFGGETKKILTGVKKIRPLNQGDIYRRPTRDEYIDLNEHGVLTFKQEYRNVTFVEGVTTKQTLGPLQYENIMAIVIYTSKRLIDTCKPFQGQNLSEDIRASLKTQLEDVLETIRQTDNSLIGIDGYNLPPYSVNVQMGAFVEFDKYGELQRQSKITVEAKIVPAGALREIELGVIII